MPKTKKTPTIALKEALRLYNKDKTTFELTEKHRISCEREYNNSLSELNEAAKQAVYATEEYKALIALRSSVRDLAKETKEHYEHEFYNAEGDWDFVETNDALRKPLEGYVKQLFGVRDDIDKKIGKMLDEEKKKLYNDLVAPIKADFDLAIALHKRATKNLDASCKAVLRHPDAAVSEKQVQLIIKALEELSPSLAFKRWGYPTLDENGILIRGSLAGSLLVDEFYAKVDENDLWDALVYDDVIGKALENKLEGYSIHQAIEPDYAYIPEEAEPIEGKIEADIGFMININIAKTAKEGE